MDELATASPTASTAVLRWATLAAVVIASVLVGCSQRPAAAEPAMAEREDTPREAYSATKTCEEMASKMCEIQQDPGCKLETVLARAELDAQTCAGGLQSLAEIDEMPDGIRTAALTLLFTELLRASPKITSTEVDELLREARLAASAGAAASRADADRRLPESPGSNRPQRRGVFLQVDRSRVSVASGDGIHLEDGAVTRDDADNDGIERLAGVLRPLAAKERRRAAAEGSMQMVGSGFGAGVRLTIHADRTIPYRTFIDIVETAQRAGFEEFALVVQRAGEPHELMFKRPAASLSAAIRDRPVATLTFDRGQMHLEPGGKITDLGALAAEAKRRGTDRAHAAVLIRADGALPLQEVVEVLDTLRGPDCDLTAAFEGAALPDTCWLWMPALDLLPSG